MEGYGGWRRRRWMDLMLMLMMTIASIIPYRVDALAEGEGEMAGRAEEGDCRVNEKKNVGLARLKDTSQVVSVSYKMHTSTDCFQLCCGQENCNAAAFYRLDTDDLCMLLDCRPFNNCLWIRADGFTAAHITRTNIQTNATNQTEPDLIALQNMMTTTTMMTTETTTEVQTTTMMMITPNATTTNDELGEDEWNIADEYFDDGAATTTVTDVPQEQRLQTVTGEDWDTDIEPVTNLFEAVTESVANQVETATKRVTNQMETATMQWSSEYANRFPGPSEEGVSTEDGDAEEEEKEEDYEEEEEGEGGGGGRGNFGGMFFERSSPGFIVGLCLSFGVLLFILVAVVRRMCIGSNRPRYKQLRDYDIQFEAPASSSSSLLPS